ncbi:MAG: hypothetical protein ACOX37_00315 [Bacillota bacterium]
MESVLVVRYGEISLKGKKPPYLRRFIIAQDEGGLGGAASQENMEDLWENLCGTF